MHAIYFGPWVSIRGYIGISNKSILFDPPTTCTRFIVRGRQWTENTCIHFQEYTLTKNQEVGFLDIWSGVFSTHRLDIWNVKKMDFFNFPPFIYDHIQLVRVSSKPNLTILVLGVIDISIASKLQLLPVFSRKVCKGRVFVSLEK